jgi:hypothetical protein
MRKKHIREERMRRLRQIRFAHTATDLIRPAGRSGTMPCRRAPPRPEESVV